MIDWVQAFVGIGESSFPGCWQLSLVSGDYRAAILACKDG